MLCASRPAFSDAQWLDVKREFTPGSYCYPAKKRLWNCCTCRTPDWDPSAGTGTCPEDWEQILCDAFAERLEKHRSLKLFMDICVRCGPVRTSATFFLGTNDPKNMPVLRAELLRSLYRRDYTMLGKLLGKKVGARGWDKSVVKELFLLRLPVHGMPPLLPCVLPLRHRHGGNHRHRARTAARSGPGHSLDHGPGEKLQFYRQPLGHSAPLLCGNRGNAGRRLRNRLRHPAQDSLQRKGPRNPFHYALRRRFCRPRHLHLHGLPHALP